MSEEEIELLRQASRVLENMDKELRGELRRQGMEPAIFSGAIRRIVNKIAEIEKNSEES